MRDRSAPLGRPADDPDRLLAEVQRLSRDRAHRDRTGRLYVEGIRNVLRCRDHCMRIDCLIVSKRLLRSRIGQTVVRRLKQEGVPSLAITPEQFRRIASAERASGVAALIRTPWRRLVPPGERSLWLAVDRVRSPGNLGTLLRTGAAAGAQGMIVTSRAVDPFHPAVVRASMGAIFAQDIVRASLPTLARWAAQHDVALVAATPEGAVAFDHFDYPPRTVLVLGDERKGLSEAQRRLSTTTVHIPMTPHADSLNLAMAAGLLLYQAARHRPLTED